MQGDFAGLFHLDIDVAQLRHHCGQAAAGAHHAGDQRAHAGKAGHSPQDFRVQGQRLHPLAELHPGAIQQRHHRRAGEPRHAQGLQNLFRLGLGHGPARGSKILGEAINRLAAYRAAAGYHVAVPAQGVHFHKAPRVKQLGGPFPGGALAFGVLFGDAFHIPLQDGRLFLGQSLQPVRHFHDLSSILLIGMDDEGSEKYTTAFFFIFLIPCLCGMKESGKKKASS